jgi:hypothetical protein
MLAGGATAETQALAQYQFQPGDAGTLYKDGVWLRDAQHRYVLLRGVNWGSRSKLPPYIPLLPLNVKSLRDVNINEALDVVKPDLDLLRASGINVVRLLVMWKALEPIPRVDFSQRSADTTAYLEALKQIVDRLYYDEHIFVILDFHQDIAHENFGGDGFPDWAVSNQISAPNRNDSTWGFNYYDIPIYDRWLCRIIASGSCGALGSSVRATLNAFWNNAALDREASEKYGVHDTEIRLRDHLEKTIGDVARYFVDHPGVIGYEPFNEPHPVGIDKKEFEGKILANFYSETLAEIRRHDKRAFLFVEPQVDWSTYDADGPEYGRFSFTRNPKSFLPIPFMNDDTRVIFSFHYYDPKLVVGFPFKRDMHKRERAWPITFAQLRKAATDRGLIPFLSEFGCGQDWQDKTNLLPAIYRGSTTRACMDMQYKQIEVQLLNATYWNYDLYNSKSEGDNWNHEDNSLLGPDHIPRNMDIITRPYPMRSSAKPKLIAFDLASKNAAIILEGPLESDAPTVIFVPRKIHYSGADFEVRATSRSILWDEANSLLFWIPDPALAKNQLLISPLGHFNPNAIPAESRTLLNQIAFKMIVGADKPVPIVETN